MGRLENLSVELAYKINDSKIDGGFSDITTALEDGHRFSAVRRLQAIRYACNRIDQFTRYNIATAVQNNLSYQTPFRTHLYYLEKNPATPIFPNDIQVILRIDDTDSVLKFRQVLSDVFDDYVTVGYSERDDYPDGVFTVNNVLIQNNVAPDNVYFSYKSFVKRVEAITQDLYPDVKFVKLTPEAFDSLERLTISEKLNAELAPYLGKYQVPVTFVPNAEPTLNMTTNGFAFKFQIHVRDVLSMSLDNYPEKKYIKVLEEEFDSAARGILFRASGTAAMPYQSFYTSGGVFNSGVFTPTNPNFNAARVYETVFIRSEEKPETPFVKIPREMLMDLQNGVHSDTLNELLKDKIRPQTATGTFTNGTFVPSSPTFDYKYVIDVFRIGNGFNAIKVPMNVLVALEQGMRPVFLRDYEGFYGKYTTMADIVNGVLVFKDVNMKFFSHVEDVIGIKSALLYEDGGEKFRKVSFERLREYQNGTAPLQNVNALPDGRTDDYLFAVNDTGVMFYPKTINVPNVEVEYYGIPPAKIYAYIRERFKVFPNDAVADTTGEIEYFGFAPDTVFYSESFVPELQYDVFPKDYSGEVSIRYNGLPVTSEFFTVDTDKIRFTGTVAGDGVMTYTGYPSNLRFFTADSDRLRITGVGGLGSLTYIGKPPSVLYTFRNGIVETFPDLELNFTSVQTNLRVYAQRSHPLVAYNLVDLEYPPEFDAIVLDLAMSYLYEENGDIEIAMQYQRKAEQSLSSWIGTANLAVGVANSRGAKGGAPQASLPSET